MRALIVGRYQPFHKGHIYMVSEITNSFDELIVGIGSAQYSHTIENPFTSGERVLMITRALERFVKEKEIKFYINPIEDVNRNSIWVSHIESIVPPFDVAYTNNPLSKRLFEERGYEVRSLPLYNRELYSGTKIRELIVKGGKWRELVPAEVVEVIDEIGGVERMRAIAMDDK
jgi:nicotinamide-nucleotide adenylyltransferase